MFIDIKLLELSTVPHLFKITHLVFSLSCEKCEVKVSVFNHPVFIPQGLCLRHTKLGMAL